jgi:SAM-dependent methyltransferase
MVVSDRAATRPPAQVVWHDLECGGYRADLPLWHELAEHCDGPVLDVGAGSGRVTLQLARAGHAITALDQSEVLLAALRERAAGLDVEAVCADARAFTLARRNFALCVVPMQTIQLLGGTDQRIAFLRCARAHVRSGGAIALAILGELDTFDCADGVIGPAAERAYADGLLYLSRAIRVSETDDVVEIERERRVLPADADGEARMSAPAGARDDTSANGADSQAGAAIQEHGPELDLIELDRVSASTLLREAAEAGLHAERTREIGATDEHVGSGVVMLRV